MREPGLGKHGDRKKRPPVGTALVPKFDVELVTASPEPASRSMIPRPSDLGRRDFFMFFAGVGSGLLAYALGRLLASLFEKRE